MNISEVLSEGYNILKKAQIESYIIDTQLLLCNVLNVNKIYLILNRDEEVSEKDKIEFEVLLNKRRDKMPMAYILNSVEFMGLNYYVKEGVLIPRPDTEILVEECIDIINKRNISKVCDMCCGSGAIGLAIASNIENLDVWLYDISDIALEVSEINRHNLDLISKVEINKSNLFENIRKSDFKFDMIVSNPPYIEDDVISTLMEDVRDYEPHLALSGGVDGLDFYRKICDEGKNFLNDKGYMCFEIGHNQEKEVKELLSLNGFVDIYSLKDLGGNYRVVIGRLP